jgi:hypothetical protein
MMKSRWIERERAEHPARMEEKKSAYKVLVGDREGKNPLGIHKLR